MPARSAGITSGPCSILWGRCWRVTTFRPRHSRCGGRFSTRRAEYVLDRKASSAPRLILRAAPPASASATTSTPSSSWRAARGLAVKGKRVDTSQGHVLNNIATLQSSTMWKTEKGLLGSRRRILLSLVWRKPQQPGQIPAGSALPLHAATIPHQRLAIDLLWQHKNHRSRRLVHQDRILVGLEILVR